MRRTRRVGRRADVTTGIRRRALAFVALGVLALAAGGCSRTANLIPGDASATPVGDATPPPVVAPPLLPTGKLELGTQTSPAGTVQDQELAASVVQVQVMSNDRAVRIGSGVVVDAAQRLVLTSYHVVDPYASDGRAAYEDVLIGVTRAIGEPSSVEAAARLVRADPALGLAVLRITTRPDGAALDGDLPLEAARVASGRLARGDELRLFGYPGLDPSNPEVAQVMLATSAPVTGFRGEAGLQGPAWVRTQARLPSGNGGGPAFDGAGNLVGVSLQLGYSINAPVGQVRPIALAQGLIEDARAAGPDATYQAPMIRRPSDTGGVIVSRPAFAENALDAAGGGDLFDYTEILPEGLRTLHYEFVVQGAAPGTLIEERWFLNGVLQDGLSSSRPWTQGQFEVITDRLSAPSERTLQPGTWRIEIWADGAIRAASEAYLGAVERRTPVVRDFKVGNSANVDGIAADGGRAAAPQVLASFAFEGASAVRNVRWVVFRDGRVVYQSPTLPWSGGEFGTWWVGYAPGANVGTGNWEVEVYFDNQVVGAGGGRLS
jgi:S1-C subfamily serine protease